MGQPITVVEKPSTRPGIARFETNRSLTGMGHERYASVDDILAERPVDELARRLFDSGGVTEVHANGSVVIVHLADGWTGERLLDVIRGLYIFYPPASGAAGAESAASDESTSGAGDGVVPGATVEAEPTADDAEAVVEPEPEPAADEPAATAEPEPATDGDGDPVVAAEPAASERVTTPDAPRSGSPDTASDA